MEALEIWLSVKLGAYVVKLECSSAGSNQAATHHKGVERRVTIHDVEVTYSSLSPRRFNYYQHHTL